MSSELNYIPDANDPEQSVEAVPAGDYLAVIEASDYADTKTGSGRALKLTYQIIDGNFKGRKIFENLNLENQNAQAEQISRRALNSICLAVGIVNGTLKDSSQLENIPMYIKVTAKDSPEYGKQNKITKHSPVNPGAIAAAPAPVASAPAPATEAPAPAAAPPPAAKKHPWEK